jgi:hypothetical protein
LDIVRILDSEKFLSDDGLIHLKYCPNLRVLSLPYITPTTLRHLQNFRFSDITDAGLEHLQNNLDTLSVSDIGDVGLFHLSKLSNLQTLRLDSFSTKKDLYLPKLTNLRVLSIPDIRDILPSIKNFSYLRVLHTSIQSDEYLKYFQALPNLHEVGEEAVWRWWWEFRLSNITDNGLQYLKECRNYG